MPQWEHKRCDNSPMEPMATEMYKTNVTFDFNPWYSSDKEGMIIGYDSSGNTIFCENPLTGNLVQHSCQMVVPGWKALCELDSEVTQDEAHGRIKSNYDLTHIDSRCHDCALVCARYR